MGQLEKYGLYVLCLLIFLILGVTLWGSGSVQAFPRDGVSPTPDLKASGAGADDALVNALRNQSRDSGGSNGAAAQLPSFRDLLTPGPAPQKVPADKASPQPRKEPVKEGSAEKEGGSAPVPLTEKPPTPAERPTYTIMRADNYESIARELFGDRALAAEIARVNPRQDPTKLIPGKKILLPTQAEVDAALGQRLAAKTGVAIGGRYIIRRGDTLSGIAQSQLGSVRRLPEIQALNPGVDPTNMQVGAEIRLPAK